jgi:hypothetical protein
MPTASEHLDVQVFRTEDLALVTTLCLRGLSWDKMERAGRGCRWIYLATTALQEVVVEYLREESFVEPREFARMLARVKTEMHQFLGHSRQRVR